MQMQARAGDFWGLFLFLIFLGSKISRKQNLNKYYEISVKNTIISKNIRKLMKNSGRKEKI